MVLVRLENDAELFVVSFLLAVVLFLVVVRLFVKGDFVADVLTVVVDFLVGFVLGAQ